MALSSDGRFFALAGADRTVHVWDAIGSREVARLAHDGAVAALAFSPDGAQLATASRDHTARISLWKPEDLIQEACKRLPQQFKANGACREPRVSRRG
jgi:WD40 repeat protein